VGLWATVRAHVGGAWVAVLRAAERLA
jgi:hypothetical protein